ncbi:hypothetical protein HELRODRAFT_160928 [Helobdella robusta]|uniref:Uncharacterized protein n=1 Tax=Helobdella robusta TaxID=6412 RepID=T1EQV4_HELRO|nr:hypothetical protein HELRODRAFT_160928 [Helobdella robusta]ESO01768.1 hypothetical protein HELRODRAFT_160928 [Helobdella robusta]
MDSFIEKFVSYVQKSGIDREKLLKSSLDEQGWFGQACKSLKQKNNFSNRKRNRCFLGLTENGPQGNDECLQNLQSIVTCNNNALAKWLHDNQTIVRSNRDDILKILQGVHELEEEGEEVSCRTYANCTVHLLSSAVEEEVYQGLREKDATSTERICFAVENAISPCIAITNSKRENRSRYIIYLKCKFEMCRLFKIRHKKGKRLANFYEVVTDHSMAMINAVLTGWIGVDLRGRFAELLKNHVDARTKEILLQIPASRKRKIKTVVKECEENYWGKRKPFKSYFNSIIRLPNQRFSMNFENRWVLRSALNFASDGELVREVESSRENASAREQDMKIYEKRKGHEQLDEQHSSKLYLKDRV